MKVSKAQALTAIAVIVVGLLGYVSVVFSTIAGVGYALYLLAYGTAVGMALWSGFCLFLLMVIGGGVTMLLAFIVGKLTD